MKEYVFDELKKNLTDFANKSPVEKTKNEAKLMIAFIDKNIQIIGTPNKAENKTNDTKEPHNPQHCYDKHIKDLEARNLSSEELKKELSEGYEKGLYHPYEINEIWDYFKKTK